jgi:putative oxidoreductase
MRIASTIARILLGLMFTVFGLNGFLHFIPAPPVEGPILQFMTVLFETHFYVLIFGVQLIGGVLLLINQYVPLALVALAAVLANIFTFHITMQPAGIGPGIVALILWILTAIPVRANLLPLLQRKATIA